MLSTPRCVCAKAILSVHRLIWPQDVHLRNLSGMYSKWSSSARLNSVQVRQQIWPLSAILNFSRYRMSTLTSGKKLSKLRIWILLNSLMRLSGNVSSLSTKMVMLESATSPLRNTVSISHPTLPYRIWNADGQMMDGQTDTRKL